MVRTYSYSAHVLIKCAPQAVEYTTIVDVVAYFHFLIHIIDLFMRMLPPSKPWIYYLPGSLPDLFVFQPPRNRLCLSRRKIKKDGLPHSMLPVGPA